MLSNLFSLIDRHFVAMDKEAVTILMAVAVAHQLPGEMLWIRLIGPSRSGKTENLRAIAAHPDSAEMEVITPSSIRGGLRKGHRLLKRIDGKLVITKDLSSMLTKKREVRNEVFGLLRNVKDGSLDADYGTEEGGESHLVQRAKFDWILATTPVFEQYRVLGDLLGARFIDLNWQVTDTELMAYQALENNALLDSEIRPAIAKAVCDIIDATKERVKSIEPAHVADTGEKKLIANWADLVARLRSPVARDRQHRVVFSPAPEVGTELAQGFSRIIKGLVLLGVKDTERHLSRLCHDSIPESRIRVVDTLRKGEVHSTTSEARYYDLEDLVLLGVVEKHTNGYSIKAELRDRIEGLFSQF
jgi:hypothetical protein